MFQKSEAPPFYFLTCLGWFTEPEPGETDRQLTLRSRSSSSAMSCGAWFFSRAGLIIQLNFHVSLVIVGVRTDTLILLNNPRFDS